MYATNSMYTLLLNTTFLKSRVLLIFLFYSLVLLLFFLKTINYVLALTTTVPYVTRPVVTCQAVPSSRLFLDRPISHKFVRNNSNFRRKTEYLFRA